MFSVWHDALDCAALVGLAVGVGVATGFVVGSVVGLGVGVDDPPPGDTVDAVGVGVGVAPMALAVGDVVGAPIGDADAVPVALAVGVAVTPLEAIALGVAEGLGFKTTAPEPELQAAVVNASDAIPRIAKGRRFKTNLSKDLIMRGQRRERTNVTVPKASQNISNGK